MSIARGVPGNGVGACYAVRCRCDYHEALEVACRKLGISPGELDDEIEEGE